MKAEIREVLIQFARENKVDLAAVDKFLGVDVTPTTLEELLNIPEHQLKHYKDIAYIGSNISTFLQEEMEPSRHAKVTLARIVDFLNDEIARVLKAHEDGHIDEEDCGYTMDYYEEVKKELIETKFGSVIFDW